MSEQLCVTGDAIFRWAALSGDGLVRRSPASFLGNLSSS